jgi:glutaconate CoA-transferase subunit B
MTKYSEDFTTQEMIVVAGSRTLPDNKVIFAGTGLPMVAITLAQLTHGPGIVPVFEAGAVGPELSRGLPLSVGDSRTTFRANYLLGLNSAFELTQRGYADIGFIGGAEIDPYGNLNSTMMGDFPDGYRKPKTRLPGSGGASDMACSCERTIIIMVHEPRRFNEKISYITSPGYLDGSPNARWRAGMVGQGPQRVITTKAVLGFDDETKRMKLIATLPGETIQSVQDATGFKLIIPNDVYEFEPPTVEEIRLIREVIDPQGYFVKKKIKE